MLQRISLLLIACFLFINQSKSQVTDAAVAGLYNFQANGIGVDARVMIPIYQTLFILPRVSYFPSFNKTHEYYAGIEISKYIYSFNGFNPYILVGGYYNNWINNAEFNSVTATKRNFTLEPGAGILLYRGCINPFIEGRYSTKWKEFTAAFGILIHFGDCFRSRCSTGSCPSFK